MASAGEVNPKWCLKWCRYTVPGTILWLPIVICFVSAMNTLWTLLRLVGAKQELGGGQNLRHNWPNVYIPHLKGGSACFTIVFCFCFFQNLNYDLADHKPAFPIIWVLTSSMFRVGEDNNLSCSYMLKFSATLHQIGEPWSGDGHCTKHPIHWEPGI